MRRVIEILLVLAILCTNSGCRMKPEHSLSDALTGSAASESEPDLPEGTVALELRKVGKNRHGYYIDCLPYDRDVNQLSESKCRLFLAEDIWVSFYPLNMPGSSGESYGDAQSFYIHYDKEQMQGLMFWDYEFDETGALTMLSDEVPLELRVEDHPLEDFYGCWDYSSSFYQPGLEMYNVPSLPPCGDYIILNPDQTAEIYNLERNTVYLAEWELCDSSVYIEAMNIRLSFIEGGLEDSNGHYAHQGTPPSSEGMEVVDLT